MKGEERQRERIDKEDTGILRKRRECVEMAKIMRDWELTKETRKREENIIKRYEEKTENVVRERNVILKELRTK